MLSYHFNLSARQIESLLYVYSGSNESPDGKANVLFECPRHMTCCDVLRRKGMIKHINDMSDVELRKWEKTHKEIKSRSPYAVTERGRQVAMMIIEDAQRILAQGILAKKRGIA